MRVLRINDWTGPPGGKESYLVAVGRALEEAGHPQHTISLTDADQVSEYRPQPWEEVIPIGTMGAKRLFQDLVADPKVSSRLESALREFRPDLVHLHHFDCLFGPVAKFVKELDVPVLLTAHDAMLVCPIATLVLPDGKLCEGGILPRCGETGCAVGNGLRYKLRQDRVFRRDVAPVVRLFIAPSRAAAGFLEHNGFRPTRVLPPFIEVPPSVEAAPTGWPQGPPTMGFLGRVEPYKGGLTLLRAVAAARGKVPGLRVVFAGRGPDVEVLKAEAHRLGLPDPSGAAFLGWVQGEAKERFFRDLHLLAVPSEGYENFGLIGLEAMVRGRGVLGSRLGGIPDWLEDGQVGRLLPAGDVDAWSRAIVDAFADPARLRAWGEAGRARYLERFRPAHHVAGLIQIYQEVLGQRAGASGPPVRTS